MDSRLNAVELTGTVDENQRLQLDEVLPISGPRRVRVIVLYSVEEDNDETEWYQAASQNPAFSYLKDASEDIYSLDDGKPIES